jgi:hypothetical protein
LALTGIWGRPFLDLSFAVDTAALPALDEELSLGLGQLPTTYTGGSHRSMGIMPSPLASEPSVDYVDYGEVLRALGPEQFEAFRSLGDPRGATPQAYGEERERPLTHAQMQWLSYRHGVYFPWKVYYELIPNRWWSGKSQGAGKAFTAEALRLFPQTVAFIRALPFEEVGSCKLLGLAANDHGTVHRDADPAVKRTVDHFLAFCPRGDKRFFVWDEATGAHTYSPSRAYWFNDSDYHGVEATPRFTYSLRVDGVFRRDFLQALLSRYGPPLLETT